MFIIHVVTLISPDGAYGGPVRVALNQLRDLKSRGHRVLLVAGQSGYGHDVPTVIEGVEVALFPVVKLSKRTKFGALVSPGMTRFLLGIVPSADIVHLHLSRDLIMLSAAVSTIIRRSRFFVQTHGMLAPSDRRAIRAIDYIVIRHVLSAAKQIYYLTTREREDLARLFPEHETKLTHLVNGVPAASSVVERDNHPLEILFLGRLHSRKNPVIFTAAAISRLNQGSTASYVLAGPDEGELGKCLAMILDSGYQERIKYVGSLDYGEASLAMGRASIFVLPSVNEPFPMSVLEALSMRTSVIVTASNGLAEPLRQREAGVIAEPNSGAVGRAMQTLEEDRNIRTAVADNGVELVRDLYTMEKVGASLLSDYAAE